ncbi:hypothetical protein MTR67_047312 [Solanum verrucosum]|uniref:Uncharacterized protein n=1 Tax=Solanum verrucosum TaxID=315347 RepID=A0AAF0ZVF8_SOLVR|nr:hypothetical protein MTR67_047312 [Solanum verrucosum]
MAKMMTQLDLLSKHVMGGGLKSVNAVGTNSGHYSNDTKFETLYNEKVQYLGNQMGDGGGGGVLTPIINNKVGTKNGTRIEIVVGKIGEVEIGEIGRLTKRGMCLPMIVNDQKTNLGQKETKLRKCLQGSSTRSLKVEKKNIRRCRNLNGDSSKVLSGLILLRLLSLNMCKSELSILVIRAPKSDPPKCTMQTLLGLLNQPSYVVFVQACSDDATQRKPPPPDTMLVVDPSTLATEASTLALFVEQTDISTLFLCLILLLLPLLLYVRVARVETDMPGIIDKDIKRALAPLRDMVIRCEGLIKDRGVRLENLTVRLEAQEKAKGGSDAPISMPLKMPSSEPIPSVQPKIVVSVDIDADVDVERAEDDLSEEMNDEYLTSEEHGIAQTLTKMQETKKVIIQEILERSLWETSMVVIILSGIYVPDDASLLETPDKSAPLA